LIEKEEEIEYAMYVESRAIWPKIAGKESVTNFIWTITPGILDRFQRSKWPPKALKKTFQKVPKTSQSNQYLLSYQQISQ